MFKLTDWRNCGVCVVSFISQFHCSILSFSFHSFYHFEISSIIRSIHFKFGSHFFISEFHCSLYLFSFNSNEFSEKRQMLHIMIRLLCPHLKIEKKLKISEIQKNKLMFIESLQSRKKLRWRLQSSIDCEIFIYMVKWLMNWWRYGLTKN